jgi:hypothetical protein
MRRATAIFVICGLFLSVGALRADTPTKSKKPQTFTVPFNAQLIGKSGIALQGVIQVAAPVNLGLTPGSTLLLGPGSTLALNGPLNIGGPGVNVAFNGTITIPKGAVFVEAQAFPTVQAPAPQSPARQVNQPGTL